MTTLREAAQQALEALKLSTPKTRRADDDYAEQGWTEHNTAITALRAALAQEQAEPVQEPVPQFGVWMHPWPPVPAQEPVTGIIESEIKEDSHQTLDDAMRLPRAMAQAYESGYKAGAAAEREACAKVCEAIDEGIRDHEDVAACAAAIRARRNT